MIGRNAISYIIATTLVVHAFLLVGSHAVAQESIAQLFRKAEKDGDRYYLGGSYHHALEVFLFEARKGSKTRTDLNLKIARCYYHLHEYQQSLSWFRRADVAVLAPASDDVMIYAETLAANGIYDKALEEYERYAKAHPSNERVKTKIWRLRNLQYLFEDSLHYSVRPASFNSEYTDLGAVPYGDGVVFISNRKGVNDFDSPDVLTDNRSFKLMYCPFAAAGASSGDSWMMYGKTVVFDKQLQAKYENGPIQFYDGDTKAAFVRTSAIADSQGKKRLHLYFAERTAKGWKLVREFPFNNPAYAVTDPYISPDGQVLYFSSDMKGGFGGKDIYRSQMLNGNWSKPENLGELINTAMDEITPFAHEGHLYFASNGHAGLGGFDIFKVNLRSSGISDVTNPGHPVNSFRDDFGLTFSPGRQIGFFTSNRNSLARDDVFELEMDLQTYPVLISGVLRSKEFSLRDSAQISNLGGAQMFLVDHARDVVVGQTMSDEDGKFSLQIPYFSQFRIRVVENGGIESIVSLHIPRQKKDEHNHEIVVVKNAFPTQDE
jgi:tetratricopeptide (TPR) repeat protein